MKFVLQLCLIVSILAAGAAPFCQMKGGQSIVEINGSYFLEICSGVNVVRVPVERDYATLIQDFTNGGNENPLSDMPTENQDCMFCAASVLTAGLTSDLNAVSNLPILYAGMDWPQQSTNYSSREYLIPQGRGPPALLS